MIQLLFSGDFAPIIPAEKISANHFSELATLLATGDLLITNLEAPLTNSQIPIKKTGPSIKADPHSISLLKKAGVDIACLANNHIFDYGEQGIEDTIAFCSKNNINTCGIVSGKDKKDHWLIKTVRDKKIGFLNYCEHEFSVREKGLTGACGYDPVDAYYDILKLKPRVDYLIVIYHGGNEYHPLPRPELKKNFHYLADVGADAVVGHHTHVFSGYEMYNGIPLIYSLGNFFFPLEGEPEESRYGMICNLAFGKETEVSFKPLYLNPDTSNVEVLQGNTLAAMMQKLDSLSDIIKDDSSLGNEWGKYVSGRSDEYFKVITGVGLVGRLLHKSGIKLSSLVPIEKATHLLNLIRCQSHKDIVIESLKKHISNE